MVTQTPIPIAIIGIGLRLPGHVTNTEQLWELLVEGRNVWSPVPAARYNEAAFYHPNPDNDGTTNHRGGHFLGQDIAAFDAAFFNISPVEAQAMDPQQRLLLETTYEAFENAGIPIEKARGSNTGVYAAMFTRDYDRNIYKDPSDIPKYHVTGSGEAILSNRISYTFDLKGPSMTLDTGCSGSMVALHQACQSLRTGESTMALASGVNLILNPDHMFGMSNLHMLSDTGRSYPFDMRGSGYGRGEGAATVLLKRLDDALQAGDHIRAIIRNSAVNQDGKTNGITLPSQQAQESLQRSIYQCTGLNPQDIRYVEAHGTGTIAGDVAELQGIANVFCENGHRSDSLYVGSIKSNIGHLESLSGLAGLIKTVLILERGCIPPNADFRTEKKEIKLEAWKIKVPVKLEPWPGSGVRQASVNSFGYGGTNAHIILESASTSTPAVETAEDRTVTINGKVKCPEDQSQKENEAPAVTTINDAQACGNQGKVVTVKQVTTNNYNAPLAADLTGQAETNGISHASTSAGKIAPQLFVVSARSEKSVLEVAYNLKEWASTRCHFEDYSRDLAYTLSSRRSLMPWRYSFVAGSQQEFMASLDRKPLQVHKISSDLRVGFVFTGQGAQWFAMGRELIFTQSRFAESLAKSDEILRELGAPWSLIDELLLDETTSRIDQSEIAQPASTALQMALVDLLDDMGIKPQMVLGHSSGEIAAAYAAGILSQPIALKLSYCRSFMSSHCKRMISTKGAMLAVGLGEDEIPPLIAETRSGVICVACVNSPSSTTISGDEAAIFEIKETLDQSGIFNKKLKVDTAYHSHHMQKVAHEYLRSLNKIETRAPRDDVDFISTVTASKRTRDFGAAYWVENLVSKVRFCDALQEYCRTQVSSSKSMMTQPFHILIEIGPHSALAGPIRQTITQGFDSFEYAYLPTFVRGRGAVHSVLNLAGKTFEHGYPVNLDAAYSLNRSQNQGCVLHDLPTYPWDHSNTYWHESRLSNDYRLRPYPCHDLLGVRIPSSTSLEPQWRHFISVETLPWLADHMVDDLIIFPGAGYICMAIEAIRQFTSDNQPPQAIRQFVLKDVSFSRALVVAPAPRKVEMQLSLRTQPSATILWHEFRVSAISQDKVWYEHCRGLIKVELASQPSPFGEGDQSNLHQSIQLSEEGLLDTLPNRCSQRLSSDTLYNQLRSNGNFYGPCFAAIAELNLGDSEAIGHIRIPDVRSTMPSNYMQPHIIHPATLDALMHTSLPLYTQKYGPGSIMPVFIGEINISANIVNTPGKKLLVHTTLAPNGVGSAKAENVVFEVDEKTKQEPVLTVSQAEIRGLGAAQTGKLDPSLMRNLTFQLKWAVDVDHLSLYSSRSPGALLKDDYLKHLCFKHSHMTVLQIGAGTGSATTWILRALNDDESIPIKRYDFTDSSTQFFRQAQDRLQDWIGLIDFKILDVVHDPVEQGFATHSYDLIVATSLHQTASYFTTAMTNVRRLLKPGGRLIFIVDDGSVLSKPQLHESLLQCSFNGVELAINDFQGPVQADTMIVSRAVIADHQVPIHPIAIIADEETRTFARDISLALKGQGFEISMSTWGTDLSESHLIYMIVDSGRKPLLVNSTPERFKQITRLVTGTSNVFWISAHEDTSAAMNPEKGLITGLGRSALAEHDNLKLVTLDVQEAISSCLPELLGVIRDVLLASFGTSTQAGRLHESEYAYRDGQVLIPRLLPDTKINTWMARAAGQSNVESVSYGWPQRPLKLSTASPGSIESLHFVDDESIHVPLDPSVVEIAVKAHGLSSRGFAHSQGQEDSSSPLLRELAGIVSAVGPEAGTKFHVGDRVVAWNLDGAPYASCVRIDSTNIAHLPDSISLAIGAALPVSFMTAYYSLVHIADLQNGQTIMIHGAAGDVGQAALTVAQHIGATVVATVSSAAEREDLVTRFKLLSSHVFLEQTTGLKNGVFRLTQGRGVDVVFNPLAVNLVPDSCACIAPLGVYIQLGQGRSRSNDQMHMPSLDKNATFVSFELANLISHRPQKVAGLLDKIMSLIEDGALLTRQSVTTISIANIADAFEMAHTERQFDKVVLMADKDTRVKALSPAQNTPRLDQSALDVNATYVIAGGLGDLGQRVCRLMASRGAKHIVILSRRTLHEDKKTALEDDLRSISPGVTIYSMACDISNDSMVQNVVSSFKSMGLPAVKGVVQCAAVLQDSVLDRMSVDDFQVPLQTKICGTRHLSEAFRNSPLEFFIMLSSLSATIGTRGQANYAAGNAYQDALAHSQINPKTHYMALDLGMIEDSAVYKDSEGLARVRNLLLHGMIPVKSEELLAILDYAMSAQAREDRCRQVVIGIDGRSIAAAEHATPTAKGAMFAHVRGSYDSEVRNDSAPATESREVTIAGAQSLAEVHHVITTAMVQKLSSLIALADDQITLDLPLSEFGLDSLNAIQLKNWIATEFHAAVQASEILDEPSIKALSMRVASRSTLVQNNSEGKPGLKNVEGIDNHKLAIPEIPKPVASRVQHSADAAPVLPHLPLPDLEATLELYLTSARPFLSEEQLKHTSEVIREFRKGSGRRLQKRLIDRTHDPQIDNWQCDLQVNGIYLNRRDPVYPYGIFYGGHLLTDNPHSQAERAAIISTAAYEFKLRIDAGELEQDYINGERLCMNSLEWLFNANRKPCAGTDQACKYPGNEYLVALRRGHIFKVSLTESENRESFARLHATFQAMLDDSKERLPSVATLSADERDSWAELRETVMSAGQANDGLISMIEAAAFVVCLDDGSPNTPTERCNQFLLGDPSNRWSDKSLQFVVCENGVSAYICEHSMLDADSVKQMNKFITQVIIEHRTEAHLTGGTQSVAKLAEEYTFTTNQAIESHINRVQAQFKRSHVAAEFNHFHLPTIGNTFLRTHKIPAKTGYQLIIQLASLLHFGQQWPSWETLTMKLFSHGRLDWMQAVSPAMAAFCNAALNDAIPTAERRTLLREAATAHANTMTRIGRGRGFAAHLEALREVLGAEEPVPALFADPTWEMMRVTGGRKIKTDASEGLVAQEAGFLMPDPESVLVHYEVLDEGCRLFVQGTAGRTGAFFQAMEEAARRVKDLVEL